MTTPPLPADAASPAEPSANGNEPAPTDTDRRTDAERISRLEATLDQERRARREAEHRLSQAQQANMNDQEKAIAQARAEGKAEGEAAAASALAAAEFRASAAGRLTDPAAAINLLDLTRLVKDGQPDRDAITAAVDQLAAAAAAAPAPAEPAAQQARIPAGPRQPQPSGDFIRDRIRSPQ